MTNPYVQQFDTGIWEAVPHNIADIRWNWAGDLFTQLGQMGAAERCYGFALEERMVADRLTGKVAIGSEEAA